MKSFESVVLGLVYPVSIIVAGLVGASIFARNRNLKFLQIWLLLGFVAALLPATPLVADFSAALLFILFIGSSLGLGMPSCFSYFAESVPSEKRGKFGGIIFLLTSLTLPIAFLDLNLMSSVMVFATWRAWSILFFFLFPGKQRIDMPDSRERSLPSVLGDRNFRLYFAAWLMFAFVDGFASQLLLDLYEQIPIAIRLIEPAIAGISALVAGILSDWIGRKRIVIFGFVSIGIAYAILGISYDVIGGIPLQVFTFFFVVDGFAIGLLWVLFTIVLWGDLSKTSTGKFYAVGETPLFLTQLVVILSASTLPSSPESTPIFSLAAFFLFISVLPLLYAKETLSIKKIQGRQLKMYTREALRLRQKAEQKQQ
ncbi:MAG: hypothetical protein NWE78_01525 [Candidatus Bathyarchaeota archaeon]|nr:hypothetical protein [Candidatus Bathyarchaeota archaeon]